MDAPLLAIIGPTACGKSSAAIAVARRLNAHIVNADAFALYRGMDIGTAKPTAAQKQLVPHHLLDVADITEDISVAAYQQLARQAVTELLDAGERVILVGGSGLYVRAALDQLQIPPTDAAVRQRWQAELDSRGAAALHSVLAQRDSAAAAAIEPANGRRIVRALEVIELTGQPFRATLPQREYWRPTVQIGLQVPVPVLHERISQRVAQMWRDGLVEEVRALESQLRQAKIASRAVGYAQVLEYLAGGCDEAAAQEATVIATRQVARRQRTWFGADPRIHWLAFDAPDLADQILRLAQ